MLFAKFDGNSLTTVKLIVRKMLGYFLGHGVDVYLLL